MILLDQATSVALLEALRIYEGRLQGAGQRLPGGLVHLREVAQRSLVDRTGQPPEHPVSMPDDEVVLQLLTRREVADSLHVSERTVRRMEATGDLSPVKVGGRAVRFHSEELRRYLDSLKES